MGLDFQIVDPTTGRILGTSVASGKFTAETATSGIAVLGVGGGESAFAASALGQATRAAVIERCPTGDWTTSRRSSLGNPVRPACGSGGEVGPRDLNPQVEGTLASPESGGSPTNAARESRRPERSRSRTTNNRSLPVPSV